jgi:hypothetical protein
MTKFRLGLVAGLAIGFYLGTMAGRQRYEQINQVLRRIRRSSVIDTATGKAKAVVDLGVERARDVVDSRFNRDQGSTYPEAPIQAGPLAHTPAPGFDPPTTN